MATVSGRSEEGSSSGVAPTATWRPIVIAEDDPSDRLAILDAATEALLRAPLDFVEDGQALLDYLYRRFDHEGRPCSEDPALALVDLVMPRLDGLETLRRIKADPLLQAMPVVILTRGTDDRTIEECYRLGAATCILKPVGIAPLARMLRLLEAYWWDVARLPGGARGQSASSAASSD